MVAKGQAKDAYGGNAPRAARMKKMVSFDKIHCKNQCQNAAFVDIFQIKTKSIYSNTAKLQQQSQITEEEHKELAMKHSAFRLCALCLLCTYCSGIQQRFILNEKAGGLVSAEPKYNIRVLFQCQYFVFRYTIARLKKMPCDMQKGAFLPILQGIQERI